MVSPTSKTPALEIRGLQAWYGESHVLHGVDIVVQPGEVVTLLGRNGAGRTTTMRAVMGLTGARKGSVKINGVETVGLPTHRIAHLGVGYCPEERGIFSSLNVYENLTLPPVVKPGGMSLEDIYQIFPNLKERLKSQGTKLSGGEQQMLAIGRGLMAEPKLLILDEPSLGLSPLLVEELFALIARIAADGLAVMLVEQNVVQSLELASRAYVLANGAVVLSGPAAELARDPDLEKTYLGM